MAQIYPARPISMVVPYAAGGPADIIGRVMAEGMRGPLGQPVIIENVAGASGSIGVGRVARAASDGYTCVLGDWNSHVLNGVMLALQYDLLKDFDPISLVSSEPYLLVTRKALPAADLKEFVAWLRASPDQATQGTGGAGGVSTLGGLFFQKETGTRFRFVPYRGCMGAAMSDLIAGQIDFMIDSAATTLPHVRAGAIKAYAVTAKRRLASASDIPTFEEAGLSSFDFSFWRAVWVPKGTSKDASARLNAAVAAALADPRVQARLADLEAQIFPREQQTPEGLREFQRAEIEKWWPFIRVTGIKPQ